MRRDGAPKALLPLFTAEGRYLLWGSGTSDWLDGVFDPSLDAGELTDALSRLDAPLDLFQMRAGSPLLAAPAPAGWRDERRESAPCVRAALPTAPGKKLRQSINYSRRRAERCGLEKPVRLPPDCIERLAELHARRWQERGEPGVFADPRVLDHHREALPELEAAGLSRLYGLRDYAGEPLVILYMLWGKRDAYYYIGGFDPGIRHAGPGTVLLAHASEQAERDGMAGLDFLRGEEGYKFRWGGIPTPSFARLLSPQVRSSR